MIPNWGNREREKVVLKESHSSRSRCFPSHLNESDGNRDMQEVAGVVRMITHVLTWILQQIEVLLGNR